jgi:two-component system chemotaxis response regulator CheY
MSLPSQAGRTPRKVILFVDDDEDMRTAIYDMLSPGYRVTLAIDGVDGYMKANVQPQPDLIIADVDMPQLDGISMVRRIRQNEALRRVPIIFLTGRMSPAALIEGMSVGPVAYLSKCGEPEALEKEVQRSLKG